MPICVPPTISPLEYKAGPGKIVVRWIYPTAVAAAFLVSLIRRSAGGVTAHVVEKAGTGPASRRYTFKWVGRGSGERYYACVATRCLDCEDSEANCSNTIVIP